MKMLREDLLVVAVLLPAPVSKKKAHCLFVNLVVLIIKLHSNFSRYLVGNMYDSDADDSGESSEEENGPELDAGEADEVSATDTELPTLSGNTSSMSVHLTDGRGGKFLRMMEKMANSTFVSELKVVKKAIAGVANTPLILTVEVQSLSGTVALNIPPPPTNRLWYGFRNKPILKLSAKPRFGDRTVNLTHVTDWIQAKIDHEASVCIIFFDFYL